MQTVTQDKDATLNYWLDMSAVVGSRSISSVTVDPDSEIDGITVTSMGVNTSQLSDDDGNTYAAGKVIGLQVSGGVSGEPYRIVNRMVLDSGEEDDRSLLVRVVEK